MRACLLLALCVRGRDVFRSAAAAATANEYADYDRVRD